MTSAIKVRTVDCEIYRQKSCGFCFVFLVGGWGGGGIISLQFTSLISPLHPSNEVMARFRIFHLQFYKSTGQC